MKQAGDIAPPRSAAGPRGRDFDRLAAHVEASIGIRLPRSKQAMVEGRLRRRIADTGRACLRDYCAYLFEEGGLEAEEPHLFDALTTNKTDFFREPEHFQALADSILPGILANNPGRSMLRLWSAACSIGAEPYTMAMVVSEFLEPRRGIGASIIGTDISLKVLETARLGIYPEEMIEPVPVHLRPRMLLRSRGPGRREVRMAPALRAMVGFAQLNLMQPEYPVPKDLDVVFCRNVLIYFDRAIQDAVLRRLVGHLRPGGVLVLGHSERLLDTTLPVRGLGRTMFQRV